MKKIQIGNLTIGSGITKICVPIAGKNTEEILNQAENVSKTAANLVELRIDYIEEDINADGIYEILKEVKAIVSRPVILTFRTSFEGGEKAIEREKYAELLMEILSYGQVDIIDVEMFIGDELVSEIVNTARKYNAKVIMSNHDFEKTPDTEEIVKRLNKMETLGADIAKIAVMPNNTSDVLKLLQATNITNEQLNIPVVTMSMAGKGLISRLSGEVFGSAITFGAAGRASAPGQIEINELKNILDIIHNNL